MELTRFPLRVCAALFLFVLFLAWWVSPIAPLAPEEVSVKPEPIEITLPVLRAKHPANKLRDFSQWEQGVPRKKAFTEYLKPMLQVANAHQLKIRFAAVALSQKKVLHKKERTWLKALCELYNIEQDCLPGPALQQEIERKIDTVPIALGIAQAAKESGWGTSRFARQGNNLFGQWCFSEGCGLVPQERGDEAGHEVKAFKSAQASVDAYVLNLNTHQAYNKLRDNRQKNRAAATPKLVNALILGLEDYSERGQLYVAELQDMIRHNPSWLKLPALAPVPQT